MIATAMVDTPPSMSRRSRLWSLLLLQGRTRRRTFWSVQLVVNSLAIVVTFVLPLLIAEPATGFGRMTSILMLIVALPAVWVSIALQVRRLHDLDLRGFWLLLPIPCSFLGFAAPGSSIGPVLPLLATSLLTLLMILDGSPGPNRFGPDAKRRSDRHEEDQAIVRTLIHGFDRPAVIGIAAGVVLLAAMPLLLGPASTLLPRALMARIGDQSVVRVVPPFWRCPAPESQQVLTSLANRLAPDLPVSIIYTTFPHITGLSLPGGRIIVGQQAVRAAEQPEQLAALLAHELAHVSLRHPERRIVASLVMTVLPAGLVVRNGPLTYGWLAPYSRTIEMAADAQAAGMLTSAGVAPRHLGTMLTRIEARHPRRYGPAEARRDPWLASHPSTPDRIARVAGYPAPVTQVAPLTPRDWAIVRAGCEARRL